MSDSGGNEESYADLIGGGGGAFTSYEDTSSSFTFHNIEPSNHTTDATAYTSSEPAPLPPPVAVTVTEQPKSESENRDLASAPQDREPDEEIATDDMRQTWIRMDMDDNLRPFSKNEESAFTKHFFDFLILCCCC